jgi:hypothetical protein
MFLGSSDKVYIIDKVEGNPTQINGHSVWASVWSALHFPLLRVFGLNLEQGSEHAHRNTYRCAD